MAAMAGECTTEPRQAGSMLGMRGLQDFPPAPQSDFGHW